MGNCLNTASKRSHRHGGMLLPEEEESLSEMRRISQLLREEDDDEDGYGYQVVGMHSGQQELLEEEAAAAAAVPPAPAAAEGLKVKIVLTRAELEWLMAQLKSGEQRLEDVLHHMHAAKGAADAAGGDDSFAAGKPSWRPRLESILECPEIATQS